jgi:hypothetical protein
MAITRVTTPLHKFTFPISPDNFEIIKITYAQKNKIIFTKDKADMTFDGNKVLLRLSQEDTKAFDARFPVQIQVRGLTYNGSAVASKTFERTVEEVLYDGILGN